MNNSNTIKKDFDLQKVADFINKQEANTRVYIGADSMRYSKKGTWWVDYTIAVVIHLNGCNGCKVFGKVTKIADHTAHLKNPSLRLMNEVYLVAEMYHALEPLVAHDIEVHLDINPSDKYASSNVIQAAIGYIKGTCNVEPKVKPYAWAASSAADKLTSVI